MRNAAWLGGFLGGLDALTGARAPTGPAEIRVVLEGSSACALLGAIAGFGIGVIALLWAGQDHRKFRLLALKILHKGSHCELSAGWDASACNVCDCGEILRRREVRAPSLVATSIGRGPQYFDCIARHALG